MNEEDRLLHFFGWAVIVILILVLHFDTVNRIEKKEPVVINVTTPTDATETKREMPEEPDEVLVSVGNAIDIPEATQGDSDEEVAEEPKEETESPTEATQGVYMGNYELTAYVATGNPCADGVYPSVGYTAACNDPSLWHRWVHIEGYGDFYIHDTGGMASNVIDIFVGSYDEAIEFGRRTGEVYVID